MVPPRVLLDSHTTTQLSDPSLAICGLESFPKSVTPLLLNATGAVQVTPSSVERAARMSSRNWKMPTISNERQTVIQLPAPSLATCGA